MRPRKLFQSDYSEYTLPRFWLIAHNATSRRLLNLDSAPPLTQQVQTTRRRKRDDKLALKVFDRRHSIGQTLAPPRLEHEIASEVLSWGGLEGAQDDRLVEGVTCTMERKGQQ